MLVGVGVILLAVMVIGFMLAKLYVRSTKEESFVRTGLGGQKVVMNGGAIVLPIFHEIARVNLNTLRMEIRRANEQALITKDRMRVDVTVEFYLRVKSEENAIATAAQTLGNRLQDPAALREMVEGKGVDALRAVAAQLTMKELHEKRSEFVRNVQEVVAEDLHKNGLELEAVSLTGMDQTKKEYFDPNNTFDAEGLTLLTQEIEARRKQRNDIEQDTEVAIKVKNLEAERNKLNLDKDTQQAQLAQRQEIAALTAKQMAEIASTEAEGRRMEEEATITADRSIAEARIISEREVGKAAAEKRKVLETADKDSETAIRINAQQNEIAVSEKSRDESNARAAADLARAEAVKAEESVITARKVATAEREKQTAIIEAQRIAEEDTISIVVSARAEKDAADYRLSAADAESQAMAKRAEGVLFDKKAIAEGIREINTAENLLSAEQIGMRVKLALMEALPAIIAASVKPLENIDSIKISEIGGLNGVMGSGGGAGNVAVGGGGNNSLPEAVVASALKHRAMAPMVDSLLAQVGLSGGSLNGLVAGLSDVMAPVVAPTVVASTPSAVVEVAQPDLS